MDETIVESVKVRSDLIGEYRKTDKLLGYKAEKFLQRLIKDNEEIILLYIEKKWGFPAYIQWLPSYCAKKYKAYLKDKEARKYIYEKYAEKQSLVEILCNRIIDLNSKECIELKELWEVSQFNSDIPADFLIIDKIVNDYKEELKLLIPDDKSKVKNM